MKTNQEILDEFGYIVISRIIDRHAKGIKKAFDRGFKNPKMEDYNNIISKLNDNEKKLISKFILKNNNALLFDILGMFEESNEYKIIYEKEGKQTNLTDISEMLKAEPIIENGWIKKFSKELNDDEII